MRLLKANEDVHSIPQSQALSIVIPSDIPSLMMDHEVKQAGALGALRREISTLRYLKNQTLENVQNNIPSCPICLMEFNIDDRAVLKCGHSLHTKCLDEIIKRSGGSSFIKCPMKCGRTSKTEVRIAAAASLRKDDGSKINRKIEGTWGTKVDRLIADVIDVVRNGERCLIFSQWDDLLSIVESALAVNQIFFTHPKGAKMFGESVHALQTKCQVMLLNVKRGAEGLTLVEANHVFMIEPLLHCGLDAQAINRVHRIGQKSKTFVYRYIIKDTIEEKIDVLRMERQAIFESIEEENSAVAASKIQGNVHAGGLDGSFTHEELKQVLSTF